MRALVFLLKLLLKIVMVPVILALTLFVWICVGIVYACGWAISTDEGTYTLQMLLDKADSDMYENKQLCKKRNLGSRQ